jgi:diguanylate cyclase (GGDEF)-like protein
LANAILFVTTVMITALVWGIGFVSIMSLTGEYPTQILMTMVTAGICSGGVVAYTPSFLLSLLYNVMIMWPTATYMVLVTDFKTAGLLFFLFSIYLWVITLKGNQEYWTAVKNEELLRKQSVELEIMSRVDVLTGLFNRRHFEELFEKEWNMAIRNNTPLSMLVCDVDDFKNINDEYGHLAGDEIIRMTADNLKTVFKRVTDTVCRFGGEEFVVLLSMEGDEALGLAELMCRLQAQSSITYKKNQIGATISIGLASCKPSFPESKETLFDCADEALYKAKSSGKNQVAQG